MGKPFKNVEDPAHGAAIEIISAMSSLNMPPKKKLRAKGEYLSEVDVWAEHAMEHLHASMVYIMKLDGIHEMIKNAAAMLGIKHADRAATILKLALVKMKGKKA